MRGLFSPLLFSFALCAILLGCGKDSTKADAGKMTKAEQLLDAVLSSSEQALQGAGQLTSDDAINELKKLRQWEYRAITIPMDATAQEIEARLNSEGLQFWECFSMEKVRANDSDKIQWLIMCRRHPETPLRYIPGNILGR